MSENIVKINGKVEKILFAGDNGYNIVSVLFDDTLEKESIVGYMNVIQGQKYEFTGEYKNHPKYGEQFQVLSYKIFALSESDAMIDFLSSSQFEGIGKRTAKKIYNEFQEETINVIKNNPEKLLNINIKQDLVDELHKKLLELEGFDDVHLFLQEFNFSDYYRNEIYGFLNKADIVNKVEFLKKNPYKLLEVFPGISFDKIDEMYSKYNEDLESDDRYTIIIKYFSKEYCYRTGDTVAKVEDIIKYMNKKIILNQEKVKHIIEELTSRNELVKINDEEVMLAEFYNTENAIARNLKLRQEFTSRGLEKEQIEANIMALQEQENIKYSDIQKEAIINALSNNVSIITGGPGTGKTTIINAVVKSYRMIKCKNMKLEEIKNKIILCAPTGRAAKRMNETSGFDAKTIHSLLEWDPYTNKFNKDIEEQLPHELIIIDEFSMVDIFLTKSLLSAIRPEAIIVIVGDPAQLESVNPGNVLGDLVDSKYLSTIKLDKIFRQGSGSTIAQLAKNIENNEKIELVNTHDMGIVAKMQNVSKIVKQIVDKSYENGYSELETQVLFPKYSGDNGIDALNKELKPEITGEYYRYGEIVYQVNDKVMQLKNDYEKEIYNGDIGFVTKILNANATENNGAMVVTFKDKEVVLTRNDLINLTHAYAISIHKAQGSEFKVIVFPITKDSTHMLGKKLIYTAITRAKDKLIIVGDINILYQSVAKKDQKRRSYLYTLLTVNGG